VFNALDELIKSANSKPSMANSETERLSGSGGSGSDDTKSEYSKQNMTEEERKREEKKEKLRQYREQMMQKASQKKLDAIKNETKAETPSEKIKTELATKKIEDTTKKNASPERTRLQRTKSLPIGLLKRADSIKNTTKRVRFSVDEEEKPVSSKQRYEILALIKTGSSQISERTTPKIPQKETYIPIQHEQRLPLSRSLSMELPPRRRMYMDDEEEEEEEEEGDEEEDYDDDHRVLSMNGGTYAENDDTGSSLSSEADSDHEREHDFDDIERIEREKREYEENTLREDAALMELRQKNKELAENMKKMEERMKQLLAQKRSLSKTTIDDDDDDYYNRDSELIEEKKEDPLAKLDRLLDLVDSNPDALNQLLNKSKEQNTPFVSNIFLEQQRVDQQKVLKNDDDWAKQKRLERDRELRTISRDSTTGDVRSQWESRSSSAGRKTVS